MRSAKTKKSISEILRKTGLWLLMIAVTLAYFAQEAHPASAGEDARTRAYLPLIANGNASVQRGDSPVLLGLLPTGYVGDQKVIDSELKSFDSWAGKRLSLVGVFISIEDGNPSYNIPTMLEKLWSNGYVAFVNMPTGRSAYDVASGALDNNLHNWARAYNGWTGKGGGRFALIAPLQEMNGYWTTYQLDPGNFKLAYDRIQNIFGQEGVSSGEVRWVFAPNGWTRSQDPPISAYYPGDSKVDLVAFSAYNFGYCPINSWPEWQGPDKVFGEALQTMNTVAPTKPIIVAQTGTTSYTSSGSSSGAKDQWLVDSYNYLASNPMVLGIIYFNLQKECDWPIYSANGTRQSGYQEAVTNPAFQYVSPAEVSKLAP